MRILAPLALIALVVAVIVVASNSGYSGGSGGTSTPPAATSTTNAQTPPKARKRRYTVKAGDTLGAIAEKTGVSVTTLEDLNPGLDPQGLVAGQKLKLRE